MEKETTDFIPLLEDIETPIVSTDSIYPVKNQNKECKRGKRVKKVLKTVLKILLVAFLLLSSIAAVTGYRWYRWMSHEVKRFTVTESNSFPVQEVPMSELEALQDNAMLFWNNIQSGIVPEDFVLTASNLNGIFAASDFLRGNAFAEMKPNEYKMSVSLPTDGLPGGKGRFFNAFETIKWDLETNHLTVKMDSEDLEEPIGQYVDVEFELTTMEDGKTLNLQVLKGKAFDRKVPKKFIDEKYNLLEDLYNCDYYDDDCKEALKFLEGLAGVSMEDGQVVVHPEREPSEATYYKENPGHSWHGHHHGHHGHHGKHGGRHHGDHHHGEHGEHGDKHHGEHGEHGHHHGDKHHGNHHHGEHRALRENRTKNHGRARHWKALRMVRKLMA